MSFKRISKASDIPSMPHFVIVTTSQQTIHHEGDQRSRTNPGHGYPAYDETINNLEMEITFDQIEWEEKVKRLFNHNPKRTDVIAYHVDSVADISIGVSIKL